MLRHWSLALMITGVLFALLVTPPPAQATEDDIRVVLDGRELEFDAPPQVVEGRTLVPMRAIFEALDAEVDWEPEINTVFARRANTEVQLIIGSVEAVLDEQSHELDVPAQIIDGRTFVPLRFIGEALGVEVGWDSTVRTVQLVRDGVAEPRGATAAPDQVPTVERAPTPEPDSSAPRQRFSREDFGADPNFTLDLVPRDTTFVPITPHRPALQPRPQPQPQPQPAETSPSPTPEPEPSSRPAQEAPPEEPQIAHPEPLEPPRGSYGIPTPHTHRGSAADSCTTYQIIGAPVRMSHCSNEGHGSGYYAIEYRGALPASVCWSIDFWNPSLSTSRGCKDFEPGDRVHRGSCFGCGGKNGGVRRMNLDSYQQR